MTLVRRGCKNDGFRVQGFVSPRSGIGIGRRYTHAGQQFGNTEYGDINVLLPSLEEGDTRGLCLAIDDTPLKIVGHWRH